jgi:hypothetical protein
MRFSLLVLALASGACMTRAKGQAGGPTGGEGGVLPQDQTFTLKDPRGARGVAFEPEALGLPIMTQVTGRGRPNLDRLRRKVARKNPDPSECTSSPTLLWSGGGGGRPPADKARASKLREEARGLLRKLRASLGAKGGRTDPRDAGHRRDLARRRGGGGCRLRRACPPLPAAPGQRVPSRPGSRSCSSACTRWPTRRRW